MAGDVIAMEGDAEDDERLIELVMQGGRRVVPRPTLAESRARAARDLERLPEALRRLEAGAAYPVRIADSLVKLATEVDRRLAQQNAASR